MNYSVCCVSTIDWENLSYLHQLHVNKWTTTRLLFTQNWKVGHSAEKSEQKQQKWRIQSHFSWYLRNNIQKVSPPNTFILYPGCSSLSLSSPRSVLTMLVFTEYSSKLMVFTTNLMWNKRRKKKKDLSLTSIWITIFPLFPADILYIVYVFVSLGINYLHFSFLYWLRWSSHVCFFGCSTIVYVCTIFVWFYFCSYRKKRKRNDRRWRRRRRREKLIFLYLPLNWSQDFCSSFSNRTKITIGIY